MIINAHMKFITAKSYLNSVEIDMKLLTDRIILILKKSKEQGEMILLNVGCEVEVKKKTRRMIYFRKLIFIDEIFHFVQVLCFQQQLFICIIFLASFFRSPN